MIYFHLLFNSYDKVSRILTQTSQQRWQDQHTRTDIYFDKGHLTLRYFYHFDMVDTQSLSTLIFNIDLYLKCH